MSLVKAYRERKKLSQRDLAGLVGVSQVTISEWEKGDKLPTGDRLLRLAKVIGKRPSQILADYYDDRAA